MLLRALREPTNSEAVRIGERALSYRELRSAAARVIEDLDDLGGCSRVAVWATPSLETCVAVAGVLASGAAVVPINPRSGTRELAHIASDSRPDAILLPSGVTLPEPLENLKPVAVNPAARASAEVREVPAESAAFVVYTSGTTGPPKGVVLPHRAVTSNLDALAEAWEWTSSDRVVHGLPLYHVHGLIVGVLGPLRLGGSVEHTGPFNTQAIGRALAGGATMHFGVPTMYHRLAEDAEQHPDLATALAKARLLVSGSAPLPAREHKRVARLTGQQIVERYGLTETLMNTAVRARGDRRPGYVGSPLTGVEVRLVDDRGNLLDSADDETIGEVTVRGPNLFTEYLNHPEATAAAVRAGWFFTGDLATKAPDGYLRLVGRRSTDLIKSGGYKIGAQEVEQVLLEHSGVAEAAVTAEPDPDLGERIAAWVVTRVGSNPSPAELSKHVSEQLAEHKRPRRIRFVERLPRNDMGKIQKTALQPQPES